MRTGTSQLKRDSDGKIFRVTALGHWSDITAEDGETDRIKWYGGADTPLYVSSANGHSYSLVK